MIHYGIQLQRHLHCYEDIFPLLYPYRTKSLAGLPTAIIITPEYSLLRDDGNMYAS